MSVKDEVEALKGELQYQKSEAMSLSVRISGEVQEAKRLLAKSAIQSTMEIPIEEAFQALSKAKKLKEQLADVRHNIAAIERELM